MIDYKVNGDKVGHLKCAGGLADVAAEVGMLVNKIYAASCKAAPEAAAEFKAAVQIMMCDDSPVWEPDEHIEGIFMARRVQEEADEV